MLVAGEDDRRRARQLDLAEPGDVLAVGATARRGVAHLAEVERHVEGQGVHDLAHLVLHLARAADVALAGDDEPLDLDDLGGRDLHQLVGALARAVDQDLRRHDEGAGDAALVEGRDGALVELRGCDARGRQGVGADGGREAREHETDDTDELEGGGERHGDPPTKWLSLAL